jgi:hypothetical protein
LLAAVLGTARAAESMGLMVFARLIGLPSVDALPERRLAYALCGLRRGVLPALCSWHFASREMCP